MREPKGPRVEQFVEASLRRDQLTRRGRRKRALDRPILELSNPGFVNLFDHLALRKPRRIKRMRRDLTWAYNEAVKMGLLP